MERVINILVTVTLVEMMAGIGLGVTVAELAAVARNGRLLARAAFANYVCVPALTVGLLRLFDADPMIAVGFLILAACPGAPYGPPITAVAKGDVTAAVGLMVALAGSSAVLAPLLLNCLIRLQPGNEAIEIDATKILGTLLVMQLLPLGVGVALRQWRPALAERLRRPAMWASKVLNLIAVVLILVVQFHLVLETPLRGFVGMLALLAASWAAGWLLGGPGVSGRKAMTVTTSLRNVGVGLVVATSTFPGTPVVTATLVYGLFGVFGTLLLALGFARQARKRRGPVAVPIGAEKTSGRSVDPGTAHAVG